jgi:hypothetical protein
MEHCNIDVRKESVWKKKQKEKKEKRETEKRDSIGAAGFFKKDMHCVIVQL